MRGGKNKTRREDYDQKGVSEWENVANLEEEMTATNTTKQRRE